MRSFLKEFCSVWKYVIIVSYAILVGTLNNSCISPVYIIDGFEFRLRGGSQGIMINIGLICLIQHSLLWKYRRWKRLCKLTSIIIDIKYKVLLHPYYNDLNFYLYVTNTTLPRYLFGHFDINQQCCSVHGKINKHQMY